MIYLVEDDDNIRKLVCYALEKEGYELKGFADPIDFWAEMKIRTPKLIMLDIMLPGEDGISILKKLRSNPETKSTPVIMLTAKGIEYDKVNGLDSGADDYITKPFGMTELAARVRALLRRSGYDDENTEYSIRELYVNPKKHIIRVNNEDVTLSFKEYSLLIELLNANGNVVTRDELLTKIWGEFYDESRTLDVHIRKLRVKLKSAGALIQTVKNIGYKLTEEENYDK